VTRHAVNGTQQGDRDVLISLVRRLRQIRDEDLANVPDPRAALDIFIDHLVPELDRRGYLRRPPQTLAQRLRPLGPLAAIAAGVMGAVLLAGAIALAVWQVTS
jgi:hypothetical protein